MDETGNVHLPVADTRPPMSPAPSAIPPELLTELLFASRALANIFSFPSIEGDCARCGFCGEVAAPGVRIAHGRRCGVERVDKILGKIFEVACADPGTWAAAGVQEQDAGVPETPSNGLDEAGEESRKRVLASLSFCEGIPTEELQRQLPLASSKRRRFEEIMYLRRALSWLPAVDL